MVKQKVLEKDVQASCLQYLAMKQYFFFRLNNLPVFDGGFYRSLGDYVPPGLPDCVLIRKGRFVGLEFKGSSGKLSETQMECGKRIQEAGGDYYVIRSIDDLQKIGL